MTKTHDSKFIAPTIREIVRVKYMSIRSKVRQVCVMKDVCYERLSPTRGSELLFVMKFD